MEKPHICPTTGLAVTPLNIRMPGMPFNEKLAFVENVLDILIESRFGPSRVSQLVVNLSDQPELEPAVFYDLTDEGLIPCYALSPVGRNGCQVVEAVFRREVRSGAVRAPPYLEHESPHRPRGSPVDPGTSQSEPPAVAGG